MSFIAPEHPPILSRISATLDATPADWYRHDADYREGFFRRGHPTVRQLRFYEIDGEVRGITIRGQTPSDLDWLHDPALAQLEDLLFIDTEITELILPAGWTRLWRLDLSGCTSLTKLQLPDSTDRLREVYAQRSGLREINFPPVPLLKVLHLRDAPELRRVNFTTGPEGLRALDVSGCPKLKELPAPAFHHELLEYLDARRTPAVKNCPPVLREVKLSEEYLPRIKGWFAALGGETAPNTIVKLLVNGNGGAGKTTLLCAMQGHDVAGDREYFCPHADHPSTEGIEFRIDKLAIDGVNFRSYDFGGQEIYHGTHELFFAEEAINLLVVDPDIEQEARDRKPIEDRINGELIYHRPLRYFYERQRAKARQDREAWNQQHEVDYNEYLVVQTERGGERDWDPAALDLRDIADLKAWRVDARGDESSVRNLRHEIAARAKSSLPSYGMDFPLSWLRAREWLTDNLKQQQPVRTMTVAEFRELVTTQCKVRDEDTIFGALLHYLHGTGDLYRVPRNVGEDTLILDLGWALEGIYYPLRREGAFYGTLKANGGHVSVTELYREMESQTTGGYTEADRELLLRFMRTCGTCFVSAWEDKDEHRWNRGAPLELIFPRFLPRTVSEDIQDLFEETAGKPQFIATLPFRDEGSLHVFLCDVGNRAYQRDIWYFGGRLRLADARDLKDEEEARHLPNAQVLFRLEGDEAGTGEHRLRVMFRKESGLAWWPSVQKWLGERFANLEWQAVGGEATETEPAPVENSPTVKIEETAPVFSGIPTVIFAVANHRAFDRLNNQEERTKMQKGIDAGKTNLLIEPLRNVTKKELRIQISDESVEVLHLTAHGEEGKIFLCADGDNRNFSILHAEDFAKLLRLAKRRNPGLGCVVLNACLSREVAEKLCREGVSVVGLRERVSNGHATSFAGGFYRSLADAPGEYRRAFEYGQDEVEEIDGDPTNYEYFPPV